MLRKLNKAAGFTLAETLVAVLILLMVSAVVAEGLPAAVNAYRKAVDASNAQILLSTTVDALRGELSTAWDIKVGVDGTTISYQSSHTGGKSRIYIRNGQIWMQEYVKDDSAPDWLADKKEYGEGKILPSEALTKSLAGEMKVTYSAAAEVKDENGRVEYVKITGLEVKSAEDKVAAKMPDSESGPDKEVLLIRVLSGGEGA